MISVIDGQDEQDVTVDSNKIELVQLGNRYLVNLRQRLTKDKSAYPCVDLISGRQLTCQEISLEDQLSLQNLHRLPNHPGLRLPVDTFRSPRGFYVLNRKDYGDLHNYVRSKKKLSEGESRRIFKQIVEIVHHCHSNLMVVSELKLKKLVFLDEERTSIGLMSLKNSYDYSDNLDDAMKEHSGCPAYVCPEMLSKNPYSGIGADMWSLGVILFTLLAGRYPFYAKTPQQLFTKIKSGDYRLPDDISFLAKSVLSALLQINPSYRLTTSALLEHPWFMLTDDEACDRPVSFHTVPKSEDPLM